MRQPSRRTRSLGSAGRGLALAPRSAFTLLELMLALALTAVILALLNMAVEMHLRTIESRRRNVEESQLARSLLRIIADDIRATVQAYEQDMSGVEKLLQSASGGRSGGGGGGSQGSGSSSSQGGAGTASGEVGAEGAALAGTGLEGDISGLGDPEASTGFEEITIPELPGLYGNQYQLQIDVSRLPRVEEYQPVWTEESAASLIDIPSDVKTVTYFVQSLLPGETGMLGSAGGVAALDDPTANPTGLVRRELDRAITSAALQNGNMAGLETSGDVLAPEVVGIEFRYFDGLEWRLEWDTSVEQMLPLAVQILLAIASDDQLAALATTSTLPASETGFPAGARVYSMIVALPTGGQPSGDAAAMGASSLGVGL